MIFYHTKGKMKNKKIALIIIVFLFVNLIGWITPTKANFNNTRTVKFEISSKDLVDDEFYINNVILRSRLMVTKTAEIDENYSSKFYYNQLSMQMSKDIYNGLLENVDSTEINVPADLTFNLENTDDETLQETYNKEIKPYIYDAFCAFILDNPKYYWITYDGINGEIMADVNDDTGVLSITGIDLLVTKISESDKKDEFNSKVSEVANSINADNLYDLTKGIHDYICQNVEGKDTDETSIDRTAYGALINNLANSEGQANLFVLLCREKGINAVSIRGSVSGKDEQWVAVYQPDEQKWYAVDIALDNSNGDSYDYFLIGNNKEINGEKFSASHIANVIAYQEQATTFKAPALTNLSYGEFGVSVEYSTTEPTKDNVVVTITANREIKEVEGWTLSEDKKSLQKTYTENVRETITITSENDETVEQEILIENIDKTAPNIEVRYSTTELTTESVVVTLVSDEELQELSGWELSADKKSLTKEYSENTTETVVVYDLVSNSTEVNISINNIAKGTFECEVNYSQTEPTNGDVTVTITADRELQELSGWELSADKKSLTKTYSENTKENLTIQDTEGNMTTVQINIDNIDRESPELEISYSITENTNQNVVVTIKSNEPLKQPEGWSISSDKCTITKTYFQNASENIVVEDLAGNQVEESISVQNIDKNPPELKIDYKVNNGQVIVTITSNEPLQELEGLKLSDDKMQLTKVYTENLVDVLDVKDLVGNITEASIEITSIEEGNNNNNNNNNNSQGGQTNDPTTSNNKLPHAGLISIVLAVVVMIGVSIVLYLKYKQYDIYTKISKK